MDLPDWFKGFEKGIARLSSEQRAAFFSECSKNCVDGGVLSIYRKLYKDANGDMDVFFQMANELPGVRHYKIFCVNVKYGIQYGFRIFYLIALQNEENYEREESCSA